MGEACPTETGASSRPPGGGGLWLQECAPIVHVPYNTTTCYNKGIMATKGGTHKGSARCYSVLVSCSVCDLEFWCKESHEKC